jgi:hypothetical protein
MQPREVMMTKLSSIDAEARRLAGRAPEAEQCAFQAALITCCEQYWEELRGPQPPQLLARTLWSVTPPLAELFVDMVRSGDAHWPRWCWSRSSMAMLRGYTSPLKRGCYLSRRRPGWCMSSVLPPRCVPRILFGRCARRRHAKRCGRHWLKSSHTRRATILRR